MKQIKFLKNISCEGKSIWYKDCCYDVISEIPSSSGLGMYKLLCEDLQMRGIDKTCENVLFITIEIDDKITTPAKRSSTTSRKKKNKKN